MWLAAGAGVLFGFLGSIPIAGPISVLVFARAMEGRIRSGFWLAAGAGLAEGFYAFLAFWGFSALLDQHPVVESLAHGLAAVLLGVVGYLLLRKKHGPKKSARMPIRDGSRHGSFFLGLVVTALNPTLIVTWTAAATVLLSSGLVGTSRSSAILFGAGAVTGIVGWFAALLVLVHRGSKLFSPRAKTRVMQITGALALLLSAAFLVPFVGFLCGRR